MSLVKALAEGKVSSAVDVYEVYKALFKGERPLPVYEPYCDPDKFFSITYVTPAFKQYLADFLRKLSAGESEIYLMPAILGAGKSHFLALVLHLVKLYGVCRGDGGCVKRELAKYGVDIDAPNIGKAPVVYVFHGQYEAAGEAKELMNIRDKEKLRGFLRGKTPVVLVFDETQYLERKNEEFPLWIQMLAEVARELPGVFLFVSFSLFPGERPDLSTAKSQDAVKRVNPVTISLDTVNNIASIFRRWAGLSVRQVDSTPLRGVVDDRLLADFDKRINETYPFNPVFLDVVLQLANESIVERTRVQLTRELLRTLARAYLKANDKELVVFAHLPELKEILVIGGALAGFWDALLNIYAQDLERVKSRAREEPGFEKTAISVLRHVLLVTFLNKLLPSPVAYPSEDDVIAGNYNGVDIRPADIRRFLQEAAKLGLHVEKLAGNRYIYWYIGDEVDAIREAMLKFGDDKALDFVANLVASVLRDKVDMFSRVYISGLGESSSHGKIQVVNKDEWEELLKDPDSSTLAVDILDFGVSVKRNNLVVIRHNDKAEIPPVVEEILKEIYKEPGDLKKAVVELGRAVLAVDEVAKNLHDYFKDLLSVEDDKLKREFEELLKSRLEKWRENLQIALRSAVTNWLSSATIGFKNASDRLDKLLGDLRKRKKDVEATFVEQLFESGVIQWNSFVKLGDLWSMYLNNESFPAIPISFDEFKRLVKDYCDSNCGCIFEVDGKIRWLVEHGCDKTVLSGGDVKNVGLVPVFVGGKLNDWAIEKYLNQLAQDPDKNYIIIYKKPSGEVKKPVHNLLMERGEWDYLMEGRLEVEARRGRRITVYVDGVPTLTVDRQPGSVLNVSIEADADIRSVVYRLDYLERELAVRGKTATFSVVAPKEPGEHFLDLDIVFEDGYKEARRVKVVVKGKCKKIEKTYRISEGDLIKNIRVSTTKSASDLVDYLLRKNIAFVVKLNSRKGEQNEELSMSAKFVVRDRDARDKVIRLLKAVEYITPSIDGVFEFDDAVKADADMANWFKTRSDASFEVEREAEC